MGNRILAVIILCVLLLLYTAAPLASGAQSAAVLLSAPVGEVRASLDETITADPAFVSAAPTLSCKSAVLMEATTGTVLYEKDADLPLPPASVTKIMTLLLVMEAIDAGTVRPEDTVSVSENAASMGGSQIFLKEGERMSVEDLIKSVVIASANDAAVALAEHIAGSVDTFVGKMNAKARALGMKNTVFENVTGLDDTAEKHLTSARDIARMSAALLAYPTVLNYSTQWMDSVRDGAFTLTNTNRLIRFYRGCTGLKTGSTSKAGFCVSATAEREGLSLICVIMGAQSSTARNLDAAALLDWGFANFGTYTLPTQALAPIPTVGSMQESCPVTHGEFCVVLPQQMISTVSVRPSLPECLSAPVEAGACIGELQLYCADGLLAKVPVYAAEAVRRIGFFEIILGMLAKSLLI